MGGKGSAPSPPDMSQIASAQVESAKMWEGVAREQLAWAKEQGQFGQQLLERVLGVQLPQLEAAFEMAQKDRARYEEVFQPIEDNLIKEFEDYDTEQRREQEAARRQADVGAAFEAQRNNALQRLEGYGIDPSQTRSMAMDRDVRAMQAAQQALAGNQGRQQVEQMGRALRGEAINIGRGMPAQVAQSMGIVNQTAGGATSNFGQTTGATTGAMSGAFQAGNMSNQSYNSGANTMNMGYQNQLAQWNANASASSSLWGGLGELAGTAMMAYGSDPAIKENVTPAGSAMDAIGETPAYEYDYKPGMGLPGRHVGPMADDMQQQAGVGNGQAIPVQDMLGLHHQALAEIKQVMEQGGEIGDSFIIPKRVLDQEGRQKFSKLLEKWSDDSSQKRNA